MYLRELKINGFKSFAERTTVRLDAGITCIVGPNGCGKSNIVDAIRWVLGEQSAKALRGGKMLDVIFQGTDNRKPLPSCEVSLAFADCEAELGTQFNEVEITRRVDREGSGDYYINGKRCRLKDIQQLFMDTGIGRSGYSFMMQGQIDQILSSNPQERRAIFEEAAGITKYKAQRKEALNKLTLTEQNLARITDVIEQMTRQIGSLQRQASKALRYKRLKHRLTHLDLARMAYDWGRRQAVITELTEQAAGLRTLVEAATHKVNEGEQALDALKVERSEALEQLQAAQQAVFDLRSEKENASNQIQFAEIRQQDLEERITSANEEISAIRQQVTALQDKAQSTQDARTQAEQQLSGSDARFQSRHADFESIAQSIADAERQFSQNKQQMLVKEGAMTRLRSQLTTSEVDLKTFEVKHAALGDALHESRESHGLTQQKLDATKAALEQAEAAVTHKAEAVERAKATVTEKRQAFRELQQAIRDTDRELAQLTARQSTLRDMQTRFEGFSAGAKAILQGKLSEVLSEGTFQPLSAILEAQPQYTAALETLLGTAAEAIVLDEKVDRVAPVLRQLDEQNLGRACLQVSVVNRKYDLGDLRLPDWIQPVNAVVKARETEHAELVKTFFEGCYVCEHLGDFLSFWDANYHFNFLFVATNHDELVSHRGLVYGGRRRKAENSFIQRKQQIEKLDTQIADTNERLTTLTEQSQGANAAIDTAEAALETARSEQQAAQQDVSTLKSELRTHQQTLQQLDSQMAKQQRELNQLEEGRAQSEAKLADARQALSEGEAAITQLREVMADGEKALEKLHLERDTHRESLTEARLELAQQRQQLELFDRGLAEAETQQRDLQQRQLNREQAVDDMRGQLATLAETTDANQSRLVELEKTLTVTTEQLATAKTATSAIDGRIGEAEKALSELRQKASDNSRKLSQIEVKLAEARSQAQFVAEKVQTEYDRDIADIGWKLELWQADEAFETRVKLDELSDGDMDGDLTPVRKHDRGDPSPEDIAEMENTNWRELAKECDDLRRRIQSLGAINLVAIEEYAELKEQYDFRKNQCDDIWRAKEELVRTIDEINETSQDLFAETFETIRKNFTYTFEKLFAGGSGDLELIEAEDILDSGIEIVARPPGTRLRSLSLLSGGQRTMTAVALLFAIYMVKPSPFAVLDELDAPLDDINVGRFTDIVKEFVQYSQFLIVTHNKRTMSVADAIFGVTMQERGVTRLVSMKFSQDKDDTLAQELITA